MILSCVNASSLSLRKLYSDTELSEMCKNVNFKHTTTDLPFSEYTNQVAGNSSDTLEFFERFLTNHNDFPIILLLKKIVVYIFVFVLSGIVSISWISFTFCCLCSCGLFKKHKPKRSNLFKIIIFGLLGILIIVGSIAIILSSRFNEYLDSSICSFFQFFDHTLEGDNQLSKTPSKWVGLNNIEKELNITFNEINATLNILSDDTDKFETNFDNYSNQFQNLLHKEVKTSVRNPSNLDELIETDYSERFPQLLNQIEEQFRAIKELLNEGITLLKSKLDNIISLDDIFENIKAQITDIINSISNVIAEFRAKLSQIFKDIRDNISNHTFLGFRLVFGLFISFAVIGLCIFILQTCSNKIMCRCIVHVLWIGFFLFIIGGLIVGGVLGIVGTIASELIKTLPRLFSDSFLNQDDTKVNFGDFSSIVPYLTACLEENGNFINNIGMDLEIEGVETIIPESKAQLNEFRNQIEEHSNIEQLQTLTTTIQTYHDDCSLAFSSVDPTKFPEFLENLNSKFTDEYNDTFITKNTECPEGKTYLSPGEPRSPDGSYCLIACEWKFEQIEQVYSDLDELIIVFRNLSAFIEDHEKVTEEMLNITRNLDSIFYNMRDTGLNFSEQVQNSITSFETYYNSTLTEGGALENKVNCSPVKNDLITFIDQLFNRFANRVTLVGTVCIICSLVAYFAAIMLIIFINSSHEEDINIDELSELIRKY